MQRAPGWNLPLCQTCPICASPGTMYWVGFTSTKSLTCDNNISFTWGKQTTSSSHNDKEQEIRGATIRQKMGRHRTTNMEVLAGIIDRSKVEWWILQVLLKCQVTSNFWRKITLWRSTQTPMYRFWCIFVHLQHCFNFVSHWIFTLDQHLSRAQIVLDHHLPSSSSMIFRIWESHWINFLLPPPKKKQAMLKLSCSALQFPGANLER